ncbi:MAG: UdgX family uracil-DNA binding protein, partial [Henriciella sp.]|uniref:UdgX family uracil-DNA binding protein n=1 Tax=Henriciella sp. TaxID=1968823 RepID=UPI003C72C39E
MIEVALDSETDFAAWREAARRLCAAGIRPGEVDWQPPGRAGSLLAGAGPTLESLEAKRDVRANKAFLSLAEKVICHTAPERFDRLYSVLCKVQKRPGLLSDLTDPDVSWLKSAEKAIRRDVHKMHAFVRFREAGMAEDGRERFAAWFEPTHRITRLGAPFFMRRFPNMDWVIVTPEATAIWDGSTLTYGPGGQKSDVPSGDAVEDQWRTYFRSIFNPARLKVSAMTSEMPKKYWANLPEADLIPAMISGAQTRTRQMQEEAVSAPSLLSRRLAERRAAEPDMPEEITSLEEARKAVSACQRCPLYKDASQAVFGEGPSDARLMIVGEQPGDEEDIAGRPFVGPAGKVLDRVLGEAGIDRKSAYVTNAVKHFKFTPRGKRRMHQRPNAGEIDACRWWLDLERGFLNPDVTVALGATAARGLFGKTMKIGEVRGRAIDLGNRGQAVVT